LHFHHLILLENFFLFDAATKGATIGAFFLRECGTFVKVILGWAVELFLKDRIVVNVLELSFEVT